jgi:hypothetical protein
MLESFISKITTTMLTFLLPFLPSSIQEGLESLTLKREWREIENVTSPQQVIWRDDNRILFVLEEELLEYRVDEDALTDVGEREPNQFVGIGRDDEIIFCDIEHYIISSPDEFSTKLTVKIPNKKDNELCFFETIRPLSVNGERIIAVTALDFLEKNFYSIDIENGSKRQIPPLKKVKRTVLVPKDIQFKKAYIRNRERYVVEDVFGNIYLFTEETNPSGHMQKSIPSFLKGK